MTLVDQGGTWLIYFCLLLCVTKENLQNHIPKGIWDTMEGDDVALASQLVQETMVQMKVYRYKCCIGKFFSATTILPDFALPDCHTIFGLSLPRTSPHVNLTKLYQINKLSYNPTQVNRSNIKLLKAAIQLTLNNKP